MRYRLYQKFALKKGVVKIASVLLVLFVFQIIAMTFLKPQAEASWFDDSYSYRQQVSFVHNADIATPRRVTITIDTATLISAGKMQADCDDSRFTDYNGKLLRYQLVSGCNSASTDYDVVYPTIINGTNAGFMYYGNPSATSESDSTVAQVTALTPSGALSYASEEKGRSPLLFWKFNEGYGTTAHDTSSSNNDGTLGISSPAPITELEQQINIINQEYTTTNTTYSPTDNSLGLILWDGSAYTGETVYFEALISCDTCSGGNTAAQVSLYTDAGAAVANANVSTTSSSYTLVRSSAITADLVEDEEYTVRLKVDATSGTAKIKAARLIILQADGSALTDTVHQIELGSNQEIGSTTYSELTDPKYYYYNEDQYSGSKTAYLEATMKGEAGSFTQGNGRVWSSGFENNSTTDAVEWDYVGTPSLPTIQGTTVRSGDYAMQVTSLASGTRKAIGNWFSTLSDGPLYFRVYVRVGTLPSAENRIISLNSSTTVGTGPRVYITLNSDGTIKLYDEDGQIGSASSALSTDTWYRIEMEFDSNGAGATDIVRARIDGTEFAGSSTRNLSQGILSLQVGGNLNNEAQTIGNWYFDDVAINNSTGGYPGPGKIIHLRANNTGDNSSWASDYTAIDETPPNDATDYIESHTLDQIEDVNVDNTPSSMNTNDTINVVSVGVRAASNNTTSLARFVLRAKATSGGTVEESSNLLNNTTTWYSNSQSAPLYALNLYDLPGASTTEWTKTELDTAQIGVRLSVSDGAQEARISSLWMLVDYTPEEDLHNVARAKLQQCDESSCIWSDVANSTVTNSTSVFDRVRSSSITLTDDRRYRIVVSKSINAGTIEIANAKLVLEQADAGGVSKVELIQQQVNTDVTDADSTYTSQSLMNTYNPDNYSSTPYVYFESTLKTSAGTGYVQAYDTTGASAIASSEISTTSTSYTRVRSASLTMPESTSAIDTQIKNSATNTTSVASSWLIISFPGDTSGLVPLWQHTDKCLKDSCLYFSGNIVTRDYATDAELDPGTGSFSVSAWFRHPTSLSGTDTLISRFSSGGYRLYTSGSGFCFGIDNDGASFPSDSACSNSTYADAKWHYVTAVKNGTSNIQLYIDGVLVGTDSSITGNSLSGSSPTFIVGSETASGTNPWDGFVDDVKYYNYALSEAQIKTNYSGPGTTEGATASFGDSNKFLTEGLIGYWNLNETSGDATGASGHEISLTNNGTTTYGAGKYGNGSEHVPASSQYFSTLSAINGINSVSFWVNPDSTTNYYLSLTASASVTSSGGTLSATGFTNPKIYVNGVETTTIAADSWQFVTVTSETAINADAFYLGRQSTNYFDGTLDEVRLFNRVLSPDEIKKLYQWAPGPVIYYPLNEGSGTTSVYDHSGNGNTAAMTGSMTSADWVPGKYGKALDFDGSDDAITVATASDEDVDFSGDQQFYGSAWVYVKSMPGTNEQDAIISKWDQTSTQRGYRLIVENDDADATGNFQVDIYDESADQTISASGANDTVSVNTWYYVTFSFNGGIAGTAGDLQLYTNGQLTATNTANASFLGLEDVTADFTIGDYDTTDVVATNTAFAGIIDDVQLYNYTRTPTQIIEDMNAGHPAVGTPVGSTVGHWKFDEGYSTTAYDSSPNNNDVTLSSASWSTNGKFGKAWNGTGSLWASRGDDDDFDFAASEDFSISMWFRSDNAANPAATEYLVNKASATVQGYAVYANTSGNIVFGIDDDTTWSPDDTVTSTSDIYDATWHHILVTKSATSSIQMYVDGVLQATDGSIASTATLANSLSLYIGDRDGTDNGDEFTGDLDEVKIYRFALSSDQVKTDFTHGKAQVFGSKSTASDGTTPSNSADREYCVPGDTSTCNAPVAEWKFEEKTGTTANDTSGNPHTGTLANGTTWSRGISGGAVTFDGSNDQVTISDASALNPSELTVSLWFKKARNGQTEWLLTKWLNDNNYDYALALSSSNFVVSHITTAGSNTQAISASAITDTKWHHAVLTFNDTTNTHRLYIDGMLSGESSTAISLGNTAAGISLGVRNDGWEPFRGSIDTVRIYNYARTPAQVAWEYNRGAPVAHYKFDECSGTTINDWAPNASGGYNGHTGTLTIGAGGTNTAVGTCTTSGAWFDGVSGKFGKSMEFDGTDDYVQVTDNANLRFDAASRDFSVFAWVKRAANGSDHYVISKEDADNDGWRILLTSTNTVQCSIDAIDISSTATITDTNWHHIGCVVDRDGNGQVYIDGSANGSSASISSEVMATTSNMRIGTRSYSSTNYFSGSIDDIRIFPYALTTTQIKAVMNNSKAIRFE